MRIWLTLSNYERRLQKLYSIFCGDDSPVFEKKTQTFIHEFYTWCVFPKHKIQCQQCLISALIDRQYILRIPKVLLTSNNPKLWGPGSRRESFRRALWWWCAMAGSDSKRFLTIYLILVFRQSLRIWGLIKFGWLLRQKFLVLGLDYNHPSLL